MKRWILATCLMLGIGGIAGAQLSVAPPPILGAGFYGLGSQYFNILNTASLGNYFLASPPSYTLYGYNSGAGKYYPMAVDASGNLILTTSNILSAPALVTNGSGVLAAAPNTYGCQDGYDHLPCTLTTATYGISLAAQTSSISYPTVNMPAYVAGAVYRQTMTVCITSLGSAGTIIPILDPLGATAITSGAALTLTAGGCETIQTAQPSKSGSNLFQYATTVAGNVGGQYSVNIVSERIQ